MTAVNKFFLKLAVCLLPILLAFSFDLSADEFRPALLVTVSMLLAGLSHLHGHTALTLVRATPYAIGGVAAFWTIDRVSSFL